MKTKAVKKEKVELKKKTATLIKIYDLYIQRTEGFYYKYVDSKLFYYKQNLLFDLIKVKILYPRLIYYQKYPPTELTISSQKNFTIQTSKYKINKEKNNFGFRY